jgi:hypothetical protein
MLPESGKGTLWGAFFYEVREPDRCTLQTYYKSLALLLVAPLCRVAHTGISG